MSNSSQFLDFSFLVLKNLLDPSIFSVVLAFVVNKSVEDTPGLQQKVQFVGLNSLPHPTNLRVW